jgi:hypothetical protein
MGSEDAMSRSVLFQRLRSTAGDSLDFSCSTESSPFTSTVCRVYYLMHGKGSSWDGPEGCKWLM